MSRSTLPVALIDTGMTPQRDGLADDVFERHEELQSTLVDATAAAYRLVLDPNGRDAAEQQREAYAFIADRALPHMRDEERDVFPRALASGVSMEAIRALTREHRALRQLEAELRARIDRPLDDGGALLLLRFLQSFDAHVAREEAVLVGRPLSGR